MLTTREIVCNLSAGVLTPLRGVLAISARTVYSVVMKRERMRHGMMKTEIVHVSFVFSHLRYVSEPSTA